MGKKAYRLRCRFRVGAYPGASLLEKAKYTAAEQFVRDMHKQGFDYIGESGKVPVSQRGFRMRGPFHVVDPVTIKVVRPLTAKELLPLLLRGEPVPKQPEGTSAMNVIPVAENERWEYELGGVFIRNTILTEVLEPQEHEQELRHR